MKFEEYFPVIRKLTKEQQKRIQEAVTEKSVEKGTVLHDGAADCTGLLVVQSGMLRAYILSEEGREITLYRLFERDVCLFSASCMMSGIQFEVTIEAEKDTRVWVIPTKVWKQLNEESAVLANYTNELMADRFTNVMWLIEQIMWKSFDKRLAEFLLEEVSVEGTSLLKITHEVIGNHLGTAREVVTRMLRYFQSEGMVKLSRGMVEITDIAGLEEVAGS
ncbi:MAG: Crp/Fnr family transcriptional regulator [Merdimonas faecis]|uniref:Crp/Fnr family transcriptional regulator n=1 Tax=Merdimonas faecis TaxID=1653435 RepID=A0A9D3AIK3_9FIRM|nr:Crp/Fnr family transcriptional regulator [Merdimonas faecis]HJH49275.1 Crp/Fnr family transcriptional regulator [Merdimonas faecis]